MSQGFKYPTGSLIMDIPIEHIIRKGMYEVADYFRHLFEEERINNRVPVLVKENPMESYFFIPCDLYGVPKIMHYEFLTFSMPKIAWKENADLYTVENMSVTKKVIRINTPLLVSHLAYDFPPTAFYFLWEGELLDSQEVDISKLDVKYLQQLSQEAIKRREPVILDDVVKNRLIK